MPEIYKSSIPDIPKIKNNGSILKLHISQWHIGKDKHMYVLYGTLCNDTQLNFTGKTTLQYFIFLNFLFFQHC